VQEEELDEHNVQLSPPGFHLIFLPFADDLRKLSYEETPRGMIALK
jgi:ATP-dependent DNA helicase 2 subunit 1